MGTMVDFLKHKGTTDRERESLKVWLSTLFVLKFSTGLVFVQCPFEKLLVD